MIEAPERHVADFAKAGAHTHHHPRRGDAARQLRRAADPRAGLRARASRSARRRRWTIFEEVDVDLALCMTVNPGWGGQKFIGSSPDKIARLRSMLADGVELEVDGGIDVTTAGAAAAAGATLFVAGSALFGAPDPAQAYRDIAAAAGV